MPVLPVQCCLLYSSITSAKVVFPRRQTRTRRKPLGLLYMYLFAPGRWCSALLAVLLQFSIQDVDHKLSSKLYFQGNPQIGVCRVTTRGVRGVAIFPQLFCRYTTRCNSSELCLCTRSTFGSLPLSCPVVTRGECTYMIANGNIQYTWYSPEWFIQPGMEC